MEFIVVSHELELPRESYSFDLDYPDNGNDHMSFSGTKVTTVENTKYVRRTASCPLPWL